MKRKYIKKRRVKYVRRRRRRKYRGKGKGFLPVEIYGTLRDKIRSIIK